MNKGLWQETVRENAYKKNMGSHNRYEKRVCTKKRKDILIVKRRERRGMGVYQGTVKKRVYQILEVASNSASVLCREEGWEEADGARLLIS